MLFAINTSAGKALVMKDRQTRMLGLYPLAKLTITSEKS